MEWQIQGISDVLVKDSFWKYSNTVTGIYFEMYLVLIKCLYLGSRFNKKYLFLDTYLVIYFQIRFNLTFEVIGSCKLSEYFVMVILFWYCMSVWYIYIVW